MGWSENTSDRALVTSINDCIITCVARLALTRARVDGEQSSRCGIV
jgi:hypothetical protein